MSGVYAWWVPLTLCVVLIGLGYMLRVVHRG